MWSSWYCTRGTGGMVGRAGISFLRSPCYTPSPSLSRHIPFPFDRSLSLSRRVPSHSSCRSRARDTCRHPSLWRTKGTCNPRARHEEIGRDASHYRCADSHQMSEAFMQRSGECLTYVDTHVLAVCAVHLPMSGGVSEPGVSIQAPGPVAV